MIKDRLKKLRNEMKRVGIDCYLIPTSDFHNSEYVSEYFMVREYFSGFTGSAGTLVVTADEAALFTDGRYFIQAERELEGSTIRLMKMGEPDVPSIKEYVKSVLSDNQTIGFDGRVISAGEGLALEDIAKEKNGHVVYGYDLAEGIWKDRPPLPASEAFVLKECYCGMGMKEKMQHLREEMQIEKADIHIITTLDDIAWLFNIRANDVECCPVLLAYAVITKDELFLFAKESAINEKVSSYLKENNVVLKSYDDFYPYIKEMVKNRKEESFLICERRIDYRLKKELGAVNVINKQNPTTLMKAVKNRTEQENIRKAHLMDAIAVTKMMYRLKNKVCKKFMTEDEVAEELTLLRAENPSFIEPSFKTICAYGANGAMIHYGAEKGNGVAIEPKGLLMIDSGGHYLEGSTDITRTFVMGEISDEMRAHFTLVVRAMLRLKGARFLYGTKGVNLDILAREVFWEKGLDYKHGTGHGVGYLLNVHEGPNAFRFKAIAGEDDWCFEEGMITTDEPGIYIEGSHGIRIENELLCRKGEKNEYGQFMYFEDLTYVPIDLDGIDVKGMEESEVAALNAYHRQVYEKLHPYFEGELLTWLKHATRELQK